MQQIRLGFTGFNRIVLRELASVKEEIKIFSTGLANVDTPICTTGSVLDNSPPRPVKNGAELIKLEAWLEEENKFRALVSELGKTGGNCRGKVTRNILTKLVTNEFAQKFILTGRTGKEKFSDLRIYQILIRAIWCHTTAQATTDKEIDHFVSEWLRTATTRLAQSNPDVISKKQKKKSSIGSK